MSKDPSAQDPTTERGTPSKSLQEAMERGKESGSGVLDVSDSGYEPITEAAPEKGIFNLVGGWVDDNGELHKEVQLRAMSGHEEDLLGNRSIPIVQRMDGIMGNCIERLGTITNKGEILRAVQRMPSGTRTHLLICTRIATHHKTEKDIYEMEVRCPARRTCGKIGYYNVRLMDLELFEAENPKEMTHRVTLPYSDDEIVWSVLTGVEDRILGSLSGQGESEGLSYAGLVRIREWNGEVISLGISDFLTGDKKPKMKLSRKAKELLLKYKNLSSGDRDFLRGQFMEHEPGVEVDIEIECDHCNLEYIARLDVAQEAFFFPQGTSRRSKRKPSI